MAANQGLYNGFLSAGLIYSLIKSDTSIALFFLICIIVAGVYGAYSTRKIKLFYVQALPALIALILMMFF